jgi:hypothetical protein
LGAGRVISLPVPSEGPFKSKLSYHYVRNTLEDQGLPGVPIQVSEKAVIWAARAQALGWSKGTLKEDRGCQGQSHGCQG